MASNIPQILIVGTHRCAGVRLTRGLNTGTRELPFLVTCIQPYILDLSCARQEMYTAMTISGSVYN